jgi:hypothetical protein
MVTTMPRLATTDGSSARKWEQLSDETTGNKSIDWTIKLGEKRKKIEMLRVTTYCYRDKRRQEKLEWET